MLSVTSFDDLNAIVGISRSIPYREYFEEMRLPKRQVEERIRLAEEMEGFIRSVMLMMFAMKQTGSIDYAEIEEAVYDGYMNVLLENDIIPDDYTEDYVAQYAKNFVVATRDHEEEEYYYSIDRAKVNAENESNSTYNYKDYKDAVADKKTGKQWLTILDGRERDTHHVADGQTVGIDDLFKVGDSLMRFPRDTAYGASPEEIVNCRCSMRYIRI